MPRPIDTVAREETIEQIKSIARQQMADNGTAAISLRAIAREMGVTAPAIYNYFRKLDDLITALIVDAFNGLADAVELAIESEAEAPAQLKAGAQAYRQWALEHPADFQLIYGNPIPNYEAPADITVPLATRTLAALYAPIHAGWKANVFTIPYAYQTMPPTVTKFMQALLDRDFPQIADAPIGLFYLLHVLWTRIHGMVMLEIFAHSPPSIGDPSAFYNAELDVMLDDLMHKSQ